MVSAEPIIETNIKKLRKDVKHENVYNEHYADNKRCILAMNILANSTA